jgi:hypothetical protein
LILICVSLQIASAAHAFSIENEFAALAAFVHALLLSAAGFLPCADCWNPQAPIRKLAAAAALCPLCQKLTNPAPGVFIWATKLS